MLAFLLFAILGRTIPTITHFDKIFVRSGYFVLPSTAGTLRNAGRHAGYWSSRGSSTRYDGVATPSAYNLGFNATGVGPSDGPYERWLGFSLRCLSTVLDM